MSCDAGEKRKIYALYSIVKQVKFPKLNIHKRNIVRNFVYKPLIKADIRD